MKKTRVVLDNKGKEAMQHKKKLIELKASKSTPFSMDEALVAENQELKAQLQALKDSQSNPLVEELQEKLKSLEVSNDTVKSALTESQAEA